MKVLFISYYFPPYTVSTPATRVVEIVKYLKNKGVDVYILTQKGFTFLKEDHSFDNDIRDLNIFRVKMPSVRSAHEKKSLVLQSMRHFIWPDSYFLFIKRALPVAVDIIKEKGIDFVFTFAPPFSNIFLTYLLYRKTQVPYAIDMQDPWKEDIFGLYRNKIQRKLSFYYERRIFSLSKFITAINMPMVVRYKTQYDIDNVYYLPFGVRDQDIRRITTVKKGEMLRFLYAGTLGGVYKNPVHLFNAIDLFFSKHYGAKVEFFFVGNKTHEIQKRLQSFRHDELISIPYVDKNEITELVNRAHVLMLLSTEGPYSRLVSTSKVYELLNFKRVLFAAVTEGWLYDTVKKHTPFIARWDDEVTMAEHFERVYSLWRENKLSDYVLNPKDEFSYDNIAEKLLEIIQKYL